MSDFSDYPSDYFSLAPTSTLQLPLHCNPVISGVAKQTLEKRNVA